MGKKKVLDAVLKQFREIASRGELAYGTALETFNGRDPLWDAFEESVDLCMYLMQAIMEREEESVILSKIAEERRNGVVD
jgi:hypothetical protein